MAYTLNNLASDKNNDSAKRGDAIRVKLDAIKIIDGFNVREDDDELREHIASIAGAIASGLPIPPIEVWVNPVTGDIELVDGHCRVHAYQQYAATGADFDGYVFAVKFDGTPAQRNLRIATSNRQKLLKPVELGRVYLRARDVDGMSRQEIATEAGVSVSHVDQMLLFATGSPVVQEAVARKEISTTEAVKLMRDHGENAAEELERRKTVAKELGKEKVTAKAAAPKPPSRPKVDFVTSCAVVLVNHCEQDIHLMEALENTNKHLRVSVDADLLNDLISAVREMKQGAKPLDADKQQELAV